MQRILRADERLAQLSKPRLQRHERFELSHDDTLVICAGFEERSVTVLQNAMHHSPGFRVVLADYLPAIAANRLQQIETMCAAKNIAVERLTYDRQNPTRFAWKLLEAIGNGGGCVFVDISAMSRLLIVQVLVGLKCRLNSYANCFVAYTEAAEYPPTQADAEAAAQNVDSDPFYTVMLLSAGVFDLTVVPELSSVAHNAGEIRLVAFPSLNVDQLVALRAALQPSRYVIIHGIPPRPEHLWRTELISRLNRIESLPLGEEYRTSTLQYEETLNCLTEVYANHGVRERIVVSPTGSKMQAVAVGIFRACLEDVQVVYPTPKRFTSPESYTLGSGCSYLLALAPYAPIFADSAGKTGG